MLHEVRVILGLKRNLVVILCLYGHKYSPFLWFLCLFQSHDQGTGMEIGMGTDIGVKMNSFSVGIQTHWKCQSITI